METQNRQEGCLDLLTISVLAAGVVGIILAIMPSDIILPIAFVGFAHVGFLVVVLWYFGVFGEKEDVPMCNMKKVVSLGRQCPEAATDDVVKCLAERLDVWKLFVFAGLPTAAAVSMMLTRDNVFFFALSDGLYLLSLAYAVWVATKEGSICRDDVWWGMGLALAASFLVAAAVHGHILQTYRGGLQDILSAVNIPTFVAYLILFIELWPMEPAIFIAKTHIKDTHTAYKRFVEDLDDVCSDKYQPTSPPVCSLCCQHAPAPHPDYLKLKQIVCGRDVEAAEEVSAGYPLIVAAYYLILRGDLEPAQRLMRVLSNRSLDEKERVALQVLEVAYEVAANPPCNNREAFRHYVEKLEGIHTPGWSFLLKILTLMRLGYTDVATVKKGILRTIERCSGDNLSIYYFALSVIDRVKPLCK